MRIAIIGAGFTGLAAAYKLAQSGHEVTVFEKDAFPGGLAIGFRDENWDWSLEKHYHHIFVSDNYIRRLAAEINHPINFTRPVTSSFINNSFSQLDSPLSLLKFSHLSLLDRLRTGVGIATLKLNPFWRPLENITAKDFIIAVLGQASWQTLWQPLFVGKFGPFADQIAASWFWSRIYKRSSALGYPAGGFLSLAQNLASRASLLGATFVYSVSVEQIKPLSDQKLSLVTNKKTKYTFDKVISTLPTFQTSQISGLNYPNSPGLGAVNLVLSLKHEFLPQHIYWLNICDPGMPFLAVVEHTHYISSSHYNGDNLIYVGNYLPKNHPYFNTDPKALLSLFTPSLKKINPDFDFAWVKNSWVWTAPFAQPIIGLNYSRNIPPLQTVTPNLYMANIQQVYPWDRGTNYAVELGQKVASLCVKK